MIHPLLDVKSALKSHELRKKGLSIREVARAIKKQPKCVQRWLKKDYEELSTYSH